MQWNAGHHPRMIERIFRPEIEALFVVRHTRCQLVAEREPAPPGSTRSVHGDGSLLLIGLIEELPSRRLQPLEQRRVDAMSGDQEEPVPSTGGVDLISNRSSIDVWC